MKKIILAAALLGAVWGSGFPVMAEDVSAKALETAVNQGFEYRNDKTGIAMELPAARVENPDFNESMYQAYLPDSNISVMIMSKASRQPRTEKKIREYRKSSENFLKTGRQDEKETFLSLKKEKVAGEPALVTRSRGTTEQGPYIVLRYWLTLGQGDYMISFTMKEGDMKANEKTVERLLQSVRFFVPMQRVDVKGTVYTYDIPANMKVDYDPPVAPDHVMVAGNLSLMTGVIALPIEENEEWSFFPKSFSNLTKEEQASITEHLKAKIASEPNGKKVKDMEFRFTNLYGRDCLIMEFEDQGSHSESYIFVQDGKYISFDYIYDDRDKDYARNVIEQSVKSISL